MAFITEDSIVYNQNYKFLESLPDNATANKLANITKHLTDIARTYLAGKADWQEVEESLRRI